MARIKYTLEEGIIRFRFYVYTCPEGPTAPVTLTGVSMGFIAGNKRTSLISRFREIENDNQLAKHDEKDDGA